MGRSEPGRPPAPFRHNVPAGHLHLCDTRDAANLGGMRVRAHSHTAPTSHWIRFSSYVSKRPEAGIEALYVWAGVGATVAGREGRKRKWPAFDHDEILQLNRYQRSVYSSVDPCHFLQPKSSGRAAFDACQHWLSDFKRTSHETSSNPSTRRSHLHDGSRRLLARRGELRCPTG